MVGTVSLAIGIAFGLLSQTNFSNDKESAQTLPSRGVDRAVVIKHCRNVLEAIERAETTAGKVRTGFANKYQGLCDRSR